MKNEIGVLSKYFNSEDGSSVRSKKQIFEAVSDVLSQLDRAIDIDCPSDAVFEPELTKSERAEMLPLKETKRLLELHSAKLAQYDADLSVLAKDYDLWQSANVVNELVRSNVKVFVLFTHVVASEIAISNILGIFSFVTASSSSSSIGQVPRGGGGGDHAPVPAAAALAGAPLRADHLILRELQERQRPGPPGAGSSVHHFQQGKDRNISVFNHSIQCLTGAFILSLGPFGHSCQRKGSEGREGPAEENARLVLILNIQYLQCSVNSVRINCIGALHVVKAMGFTIILLMFEFQELHQILLY